MSNEPTRAFTRQQLQDFCLEFMRSDDRKPMPGDSEAKSSWYSDVGLLVLFTQALWELPNESSAD